MLLSLTMYVFIVYLLFLLAGGTNGVLYETIYWNHHLLGRWRPSVFLGAAVELAGGIGE